MVEIHEIGMGHEIDEIAGANHEKLVFAGIVDGFFVQTNGNAVLSSGFEAVGTPCRGKPLQTFRIAFIGKRDMRIGDV